MENQSPSLLYKETANSAATAAQNILPSICGDTTISHLSTEASPFCLSNGCCRSCTSASTVDAEGGGCCTSYYCCCCCCTNIRSQFGLKHPTLNTSVSLEMSFQQPPMSPVHDQETTVKQQEVTTTTTTLARNRHNIELISKFPAEKEGRDNEEQQVGVSTPSSRQFYDSLTPEQDFSEFALLELSLPRGGALRIRTPPSQILLSQSASSKRHSADVPGYWDDETGSSSITVQFNFPSNRRCPLTNYLAPTEQEPHSVAVASDGTQVSSQLREWFDSMTTLPDVTCKPFDKVATCPARCHTKILSSPIAFRADPECLAAGRSSPKANTTTASSVSSSRRPPFSSDPSTTTGSMSVTVERPAPFPILSHCRWTRHGHDDVGVQSANPKPSPSSQKEKFESAPVRRRRSIYSVLTFAENAFHSSIDASTSMSAKPTSCCHRCQCRDSSRSLPQCISSQPPAITGRNCPSHVGVDSQGVRSTVPYVPISPCSCQQATLSPPGLAQNDNYKHAVASKASFPDMQLSGGRPLESTRGRVSRVLLPLKRRAVSLMSRLVGGSSGGGTSKTPPVPPQLLLPLRPRPAPSDVGLNNPRVTTPSRPRSKAILTSHRGSNSSLCSSRWEMYSSRSTAQIKSNSLNVVVKKKGNSGRQRVSAATGSSPCSAGVQNSQRKDENNYNNSLQDAAEEDSLISKRFSRPFFRKKPRQQQSSLEYHNRPHEDVTRKRSEEIADDGGTVWDRPQQQHRYGGIKKERPVATALPQNDPVPPHSRTTTRCRNSSSRRGTSRRPKAALNTSATKSAENVGRGDHPGVKDPAGSRHQQSHERAHQKYNPVGDLQHSTRAQNPSQEGLYILKQLARMNKPPAAESDGCSVSPQDVLRNHSLSNSQRKRTLYDPRTRNLLRAGVRESSGQRERQRHRSRQQQQQQADYRLPSPKQTNDGDVGKFCAVSRSYLTSPYSRELRRHYEEKDVRRGRVLNDSWTGTGTWRDEWARRELMTGSACKVKRRIAAQDEVTTEDVLYHKIKKLKEHGMRIGDRHSGAPQRLLPLSVQLRALLSPRRTGGQCHQKLLRSSLRFSKHVRRQDPTFPSVIATSEKERVAAGARLLDTSSIVKVVPLPEMICAEVEEEEEIEPEVEDDDDEDAADLSPVTVPSGGQGYTAGMSTADGMAMMPLRIMLPTRKLDADFSSFGYRHVDILSHGSSGQTHVVRSLKDGELWVAKVVDLTRMTLEEVSLARLEAEYLQRLRHPFILRFKESFGSHSSLVIITEYCEGGDLFGRLAAEGIEDKLPFESIFASRLIGLKGTEESAEERQEFGISPNQIVKWITQMALGLQYMHSQKILHCDLKTSNIFLTVDGTAKIGDLGIAREMGHQSGTRGTPIYMSPEICNGKAVTDKADSWALGCVLYELVFKKHAIDELSEGIARKLPTIHEEIRRLGEAAGIWRSGSRSLDCQVPAGTDRSDWPRSFQTVSTVDTGGECPTTTSIMNSTTARQVEDTTPSVQAAEAGGNRFNGGGDDEYTPKPESSTSWTFTAATSYSAYKTRPPHTVPLRGNERYVKSRILPGIFRWLPQKNRVSKSASEEWSGKSGKSISDPGESFLSPCFFSDTFPAVDTQVHSPCSETVANSFERSQQEKRGTVSPSSLPAPDPATVAPSSSSQFSARLIYRLLNALLQQDPNCRPSLQDVLEILYSAEYLPEEDDVTTSLGQQSEGPSSQLSLSSCCLIQRACSDAVLNCASTIVPSFLGHHYLSPHPTQPTVNSPSVEGLWDTCPEVLSQPICLLQSSTPSPASPMMDGDISCRSIFHHPSVDLLRTGGVPVASSTPVNCVKSRLMSSIPRGVVSPQLRAVARHIHELPHRQLKFIDRQNRR